MTFGGGIVTTKGGLLSDADVEDEDEGEDEEVEAEVEVADDGGGGENAPEASHEE